MHTGKLEKKKKKSQAIKLNLYADKYVYPITTNRAVIVQSMHSAI